jgi:hypothetical protein
MMTCTAPDVFRSELASEGATAWTPDFPNQLSKTSKNMKHLILFALGVISAVVAQDGT